MITGYKVQQAYFRRIAKLLSNPEYFIRNHNTIVNGLPYERLKTTLVIGKTKNTKHTRAHSKDYTVTSRKGKVSRNAYQLKLQYS